MNFNFDEICEEVLEVMKLFVVSYNYPKKWFDEHPHQKPSTVLTLTNTSLEGARRTICNNLSDGRVDGEEVITFIYCYGKGMRATLNDDWQSYGVKIGEQGQTVGPWDLLNIEEKVVPSDEAMRGNTETEANDKYIMLLLLSKHRLLNIETDIEQKSLFINNLKTNLNALKRGQSTGLLDVQLANIDVSLYYSEYKMLVAAIDMFLNKFPSHSDADLRFGTSTARYRDCAAVQALHLLMEVTNIRDSEVIRQWIFDEDILRDYQNIVDKDEEWNDEHSYFPYQMDLSLTDKSPYSSVDLPKFYFFAHLVAAMLGSEKSMEIELPTEHNLTHTNAKGMAYAVSRIKSGDLEPGEPNSGSAKDWLLYLAPRKPAVDAFVTEKGAAMRHCKRDTIGNLLRYTSPFHFCANKDPTGHPVGIDFVTY